MFLIVKKDGQTISEVRSAGEVVRIGRRSSNQIALPDAKISKNHAVISLVEGGKWMIEDLGSSNKTYLNDEEIQKAQLKNGDCIRIADFSIEVNLEGQPRIAEPAAKTSAPSAKAGESAAKTAVPAAKTAVPVAQTSVPAGEPAAAPKGVAGMLSRDQQVVIRKIGSDKSPAVTLPAQRLLDFLQITDAIDKADSLEKLHSVLLEVIAKQFNTNHIWCGLRSEPTGPMTVQAGRQRDGRAMDIKDVMLGDKVNHSIEKGEFLLFIFSRDLSLEKDKQVRATVIAPLLNLKGCFGAIYANNTFRQDHYNLADLDYLMFVALYAANAIKRF